MDAPTIANRQGGFENGNVPPTTSGINLGNQRAAPTDYRSNDNTQDEVTEKDIVPYIGMEFETEDHAYKFYNMYAGFIGFSIRKDWRNISKLDKEIVIARRFVCFKEGLKRNKDHEGKITRKDIRTGCLAQMTIGRDSNGKYVVKSFVKEHNHDLATPKSRHKLPSQRRISAAQVAEVELINRSGIRQKLIFEFMSRQAGGRENVGFISKDVSNLLSSRRMKEMEEGEAYTLLHYFKAKQTENQSFFYEIQLDVNHKYSSISQNFVLPMPIPATQNMPFLQGCHVPTIIDLNLTQPIITLKIEVAYYMALKWKFSQDVMNSRTFNFN